LVKYSGSPSVAGCRFKGAAVFLRSYSTDPKEPPEFYRALIREGTVLFVVNAEDLYNPMP
jgi:hypothetical protein